LGFVRCSSSRSSWAGSRRSRCRRRCRNAVLRSSLRCGHQLRQAVLHRVGQPAAKGELLALIGVLCAGRKPVSLRRCIDLGFALGLFAGSGPAPDVAGGDRHARQRQPGVAIRCIRSASRPILFLYIAFMILKPKIEAPTSSGLEMLEIALHNQDLFGKMIGEVVARCPPGCRSSPASRERNEPASANSVVAENDVLLATAPQEALAKASSILGKRARPPGQGPQDLDYLRVFASRPTVVGRTRAILTAGRRLQYSSSSRGDAESARPDLVLESRRRRRARQSRRFRGDAQVLWRLDQGTAEFSYISIGIGMALAS